MAKHTITIISKGRGGKGDSEDGGQLRLGYTKPKTVATRKSSNAGVSNKNKPSVGVNKNNLFKGIKIAGGLGSVYAGIKAIKTGVNIYTSINAAATGEELNNNNLLAIANAFLSPVSFAKDVAIQTVLGNLRVNRQNQSLEYQRQLTGNLIFSKSFSDGTF